LGVVDVVVAGPVDSGTASVLADRLGGFVHELGLLRRRRLPPWWFVSDRDLPKEAAELDRTTILRDVRGVMVSQPQWCDAVWCENPLWLHLAGKARRDVPVFVDVPARTDDRDQQRWAKCELVWAAAADVVTVPSTARRESLGVPGALVVPAESAPALASFLERATQTVTRAACQPRGGV